MQVRVVLRLMAALVRGLLYAGTTAHPSDAVVSSSTEVVRATTTALRLVNSALASVDHSISPPNMTETPVHANYCTISMHDCRFVTYFIRRISEHLPMRPSSVCIRCALQY